MATETITGHFTCDNSYAVYLGKQTSVTTKVLPADPDTGITNTLASEIFQGDDVTFTAETGDWFYVIAWSDNGGKQGFIGEFSGNKTILTGDSAWEVYGTGKDYGNNQAPPMAEINAQIQLANSNNAWKATAVGPRNADSNQIFGGAATLKIANVTDEAKWIWHDSGRNGSQSPFEGFNHEEFLIFRIPVWKMAEALDPEAPAPTPTPAPAHSCCCQSAPACCPDPVIDFEVQISRVRIAKSNVSRDGRADVQLTGYALGVSAVVPGMGSFLVLNTQWDWRVVNKHIADIAVPKDGSAVVPLMAEALVSLATSMRMGAAQELKSLTLKPGEAVAPQVLSIECLDARGAGSKELVFVLEVEFMAYQK